MIARLLIILSLLLSTLPLPARAAQPYLETSASDMAMAHGAMSGMADEEPTPTSDTEPRLTDTLCVGCIAPATMRSATIDAPRQALALHGSSEATTALLSAGCQPDPRPPRG